MPTTSRFRSRWARGPGGATSRADRNASANRARRQWLLGGSARPGRPARRKSCSWTNPALHVGSITYSTRDCGTAAGATSPVGALTEANFATDGSGAPLPRPVALLCPTASLPAVIDPTAQAASAGALQRNSTHRAFRRLFPPVPAACGSVGDCQAHFLQRGSPFLGVSADPRADDAIGGHGGSHR